MRWVLVSLVIGILHSLAQRHRCHRRSPTLAMKPAGQDPETGARNGHSTALFAEECPAARAKSESPLIGRIYDDRGNRMSPSHARKQGIRYRYYVSSPLLQGHPGHAGSVRRVPASEVEALVCQAVRERFKGLAPAEDKDLIRTHVLRVDVQADHLVIELKAAKREPPSSREHGKPPRREGRLEADHIVFRVPWKKPPSKRGREIIVPNRQRHRTLARSALRRARRLWHRSRAAGVGLMISLPAPTRSSRLLHANNAAFAKSI